MEEQTPTNNTTIPESAPELTKKERRQLRREEKQAGLERVSAAKKRKTMFVWGIGIFAVALAGFGVFRFFAGAPANSEADPLKACVNHGGISMHIHPKLSIFINGEAQEIPKNLGVSQLCMRPMHTHDSSGTLHVEFPRKRDFTLSEFFQAWDKPFSQEQILDFGTGETHEIVLTVNGEKSEAYENLTLRDGDQIEIQYKEKEKENL